MSHPYTITGKTIRFFILIFTLLEYWIITGIAKLHCGIISLCTCLYFVSEILRKFSH
jgi:hypothetical protein